MRRAPILFVLLAFLSAVLSANASDRNTVVQGWLSDEACATGRSHAGIYTGTNPDCAKKCVHEGKRIVLVDANNKRLLTVLNVDAAADNVGDYVEISGGLDEQAGTLHIESLKLLEKGRAKCDAPQKQKKT